MTDRERVDAVFREALGLPDEVDADGAAYGRTEGWDSVGHMQLVLALEEAFGISIDADDVFEMRDHDAVRRILAERYAIGAGPS